MRRGKEDVSSDEVSRGQCLHSCIISIQVFNEWGKKTFSNITQKTVYAIIDYSEQGLKIYTSTAKKNPFAVWKKKSL